MWALGFLIQSFTQVGMRIYYPFTLLAQYLIAIHNYLHLYFVKQTWRLWLMLLLFFQTLHNGDPNAENLFFLEKSRMVSTKDTAV